MMTAIRDVRPGTWLRARALAAVLLLVFFMGAGPCRAALQEMNTDVCVYGGTSGGVMAAVQAARMGRTVALVVVNNHLGGMTSGGLGQTDIGSYGDSYIQGLAREFYTRVGQKYGTGTRFTFEPHVAEAVFNEMAAEAGVQVFTNQYLVSVAMRGTQLLAATMNNSNVFRARMFIDASYEGDLMARAGVSYTVGREATNQYGETLNGIRAPNTGGHQFGALNVSPYVVPGNPASGLLPLVQPGSPGTPGTADQRLQAYNFRMCLTQLAANQLPITAPPGYDPAQYELLARYIQALVAQGSSPTLATFMNIGVMPNSKTDINNNGAVSTDFIGQNYDYVEADYARRQEIWEAHKKYLQGFFYFLGSDPRVPSAVRTQALGYGLCQDEFADTGGWPYQLYVREARRMVSDYVMTQSNCLGRLTVPDSIGLAAYNMDSHNCQRVAVNASAQNEGDVQSGSSGPYPVAYRSIVPRATECTNLLVPWCLSASHIAFGSIRMEPVFMILSQAAGTAAALALNDGVGLQQLAILKLQAQLLADKQGLGTTSFNPDLGIIVDNADPTGVSIVGTWSSSTSTAGYYGVDYFHDGNLNKGASSVTFTPTLPQAGPYQVYARWTAHVNRATNAPIDVIHPAGTSTFFVDQTVQGGQWVWLMTTNFNAGASGQVRVLNAGTSGYVIADAIAFVPANALPQVNVWAKNAEASRFGLRPGSFMLSRSGNTNLPLTVSFRLGGTALNGTDYSPVPSSVTFLPGSSFTNVTITPLALSGPVGDKTVLVELSANAAYSTGDLASAVITLRDAPFYRWAFDHFGVDATNTAIAGESASPAGDGVPNLVKYALGLDPLVATNGSLLSPILETNGFFSVRCTRPDPPPADLIYSLESATDLVSWCADPACIAAAEINYNSNNTATITSRLSTPVTGSPEQYVRLRVSRRDEP